MQLDLSVSSTFAFNCPDQSLLRRLVVWLPISTERTGGSLSEMHGNLCQQKSEAAGVAIGVFYHCKDFSHYWTMLEYKYKMQMQMQIHMNMQKPLQSEESAKRAKISLNISRRL